MLHRLLCCAVALSLCLSPCACFGKGRAAPPRKQKQAAVAGCTVAKPWFAYADFDFESRCKGFPGSYPRFDEPKDCVTRKVERELAASIANGVFQCDKWCVYSTQSDLAWIWNPNDHCWRENKGCNELGDEFAAAQEVIEALCPEEAKPSAPSNCVPLAHTRDLTIQHLKKKCPSYHSQAKPVLHIPHSCETGEHDMELAQALVNGAFADCKNWCIYSLKTPTQLAWFWDHERLCWTTTNGCLDIPKERDYAVALKDRLCSPPCTEPRDGASLTPALLTLKCPNYTESHSPQYHNPTICGSKQPDNELRYALANFAFSSCKNWCVYSLETPMDRAWQWVPAEKCWTVATSCLNLKSEVEFATNVRNALCMEVTDKHLKYRQRQRETPQPEDTGLIGDESTRQDAIEAYKLFSAVVVGLVALLVFLQCVVPPQDQDDHPHNGKKRA